MIQSLYARVKQEITKIYIGDEDVIKIFIVALFCGGHILIEGMPGFAKTTLAKTVAQCISGSFKRVQFSPDLTPADITGSNVARSNDGSISFIPGPLFTHIMLAEELNRAPERVQNILLDAMLERQVTVDARTYALKKPFLVVATQAIDEDNNIKPLSYAQIDKFAFRLQLKYPTHAQELAILQNAAKAAPSLSTIMTTEEIMEIHQKMDSVLIHDNTTRFIVDIIRKTRESKELERGASPRVGSAMVRASQAVAFLNGRMYVTSEDVLWVAPYVIPHRLKAKPKSSHTVEEILADIIQNTKLS